MRLLLAFICLSLAACAAPLPGDADVDVLLIGEQHDAPDHPRLQREHLQDLARRGRLGALALEMAERGSSTASLPRVASEAEARAALRWDAQAWPWERYGPLVMAAVRAGVPVLGANLPRDALRQQMADGALDGRLAPDALAAQRQAIRDGHCGLLPEAQIAPMARVQIARDQTMAATLAQAAQPGRTVVLVAGAGHVAPRLGVPWHLPAGLRTRSVVLPPQPTGRDYCAELRRQWQRPAP